jgi:4-aminobutyrate aminotransferase-like enzyme
VEASSYKFSGPGGGGPGNWVHVAPLPDPYRGRHRLGPGDDASPEALATLSEAYARDATRVMDAAAEEGRSIGAFLAESLPGCGGQIVLPDGYLARTYAAVRERGGVCIADEVQVGFGRVGIHMWGFQTQGVVPDIVTLGKPMGNGHPLGAVITTPEIAASFDTGMEFFSTFGGNPVSCAVGRAVLHVLRSERLQEHALRVGSRLKQALGEVARDHPLIGDVRGLGLYLGVELVRDPESRDPAAGHATRVANRMRERGVLISTDGPDHNVLKIKPPLQFNEADADRLAATLDSILREQPGPP